MSALATLQSREAVLAAMDEFVATGRKAFLERHGFRPSRTYMVRHPARGTLCDSKAIVGAAFGKQFPGRGPLLPEDFSGGEATVVAKLQSLGFEVVRVGEDWSEAEVQATVASYFEMLRLEARQSEYRKTDFNAALRSSLNGRSKAAVELKYQNISAVLNGLDLPFIPGYKPRGHAQLLLRKVVQRYVAEHGPTLNQVVDDLEEMKPQAQRSFRAVVVEAPSVQTVIQLDDVAPRLRLPRKVDFAVRDESNRLLGRAGDHPELIEEMLKNERFVLHANASFYALHALRHTPGNGERIDKALHAIEEANLGKLRDVFQDISFNSNKLGDEQQKNDILRHLLEDFAKPELNLRESRVGQLDVIGNAYCANNPTLYAIADAVQALKRGVQVGIQRRHLHARRLQAGCAVGAHQTVRGRRYGGRQSHRH